MASLTRRRAGSGCYEKDTGCGYGSCRPGWAQCGANMKAFSANLSFILLLHIGFYSYFVGVMRTMEKRFALSSSQTGLLNSTNDFVQVIIVLFIGYFGQRANKPRMLSCIILLTFVASLMYAMPFFVFGPKAMPSSSLVSQLENDTSPQSSVRLCMATNATDGDSKCGTEEERRQVGEESNITFIIIAIGCVAVGIGGSANSTLGFSYIDENARKGNSSVYIGVVSSMYPWGPIVGFLLAAVCTSLPEGLGSSSLPTTNPNFIGAWWLGFLVIGIAIFFCAIPLFFFPKHLPAYYDQKEGKVAEKEETVVKESDDGVVQMFKEFPKLFCKLVTNKIFWSHTIGQVCNLYVVVGVLIQQPRFLEVHYHQTASMAGILAATSGAISGVLGNLGGGIIMRKLKLAPKGMAMMVVLSGVVACAGTGIKMLMECPPVNMIGQIDPQDPGTLQLTMPCNANCSCSQSRMDPICVADKLTYFSPCHAGCTTHMNGTFSDCSCVAPGETITQGMCEAKCNMLIPYIVCYFVITLISLTGRVPGTILTFRIVDSEMRSFALGFVSFLLNLLTFIPGPIIFGMLVDSTCLIWQEACGKTGSCLFYDIRKLRLLPHGVTLCVQFMGLLLAILTWWLVKRDKTLEESGTEMTVQTTDSYLEKEKPAVEERLTST